MKKFSYVFLFLIVLLGLVSAKAEASVASCNSFVGTGDAGALVVQNIIVGGPAEGHPELFSINVTDDMGMNFTELGTVDGALFASLADGPFTVETSQEGYIIEYPSCSLEIANDQQIDYTIVSTYQDKTAPVITVPSTQTFEATGELTTPTLVLATATDNVDSESDIVITYSPKEFSVGTTTVTWTATDKAGNSATATSEVVITPKPVIEEPQPQPEPEPTPVRGSSSRITPPVQSQGQVLGALIGNWFDMTAEERAEALKPILAQFAIIVQQFQLLVASGNLR